MFTITTERAEDGPAIEELLDTAFGPFRDTKVSYRYRAGVAPVASLKLVARDAKDDVIGTIRHWPVLVGHAAQPGLLLGPLAVAADRRGVGIGAALVRRTLDMAAWARHERVLLVGDPAYYRRFGFAPAAPLGITMPGENPARLLALPLVKDGLTGLAGPVQPWRWVRRRGRELKAARFTSPQQGEVGDALPRVAGRGGCARPRAKDCRRQSCGAVAESLARCRAHPSPARFARALSPLGRGL